MSGKIVFMGTPDFAVASLSKLVEEKIEVAAVVTAPDRPAGRGQKVQESAVKKFAVENGLPVLQPERLKDDEFINELQQLNADLFVVVAFRMLPEVVWNMPPKGTINLHGSLLPDYRGAAPINWAVMNGEEETGVTTFFIEKEIDTGKIIDQSRLKIDKNDTAGIIHDRLMIIGADLLAKTVQEILSGDVKGISQSELINGEIKDAPKIFKDDCRIDWTRSTAEIHNKIRGLSPYPTAFTSITKDGSEKSVKLFQGVPEKTGQNNSGELKSDGQVLSFGTSDGWMHIEELQLEGKKRMTTKDFLLGFNPDGWTVK